MPEDEREQRRQAEVELIVLEFQAHREQLCGLEFDADGRIQSIAVDEADDFIEVGDDAGPFSIQAVRDIAKRHQLPAVKVTEDGSDGLDPEHVERVIAFHNELRQLSPERFWQRFEREADKYRPFNRPPSGRWRARKLEAIDATALLLQLQPDSRFPQWLVDYPKSPLLKRYAQLLRQVERAYRLKEFESNPPILSYVEKWAIENDIKQRNTDVSTNTVNSPDEAGRVSLGTYYQILLFICEQVGIEPFNLQRRDLSSYSKRIKERMGGRYNISERTLREHLKSAIDWGIAHGLAPKAPTQVILRVWEISQIR